MSPGFTPRPSLSGRVRAADARRRPHVSPGFTPRPSLSDRRGALPPLRDAGVSPGFTPRPSLSGPHALRDDPPRGCVAGVHTSAFVERTTCPTTWTRRPGVSPGFTPRPSLSARAGRGGGAVGCVSPGFTPRPSLSAVRPFGRTRRGGHRVAGVHTSAFVERSPDGPWLSRGQWVSPGFTPRPSLSVDERRDRFDF